MVQRPTYGDANVVLRLYEMRREPRMRQARAWFTANCKVKSYEELLKLAPSGTDENASVRMVTSYWDLVASFMTSGVLHKELFFQSGRELLLVWERVAVEGAASVRPDLGTYGIAWLAALALWGVARFLKKTKRLG